jgi:hypothetical protein
MVVWRDQAALIREVDQKISGQGRFEQSSGEEKKDYQYDAQRNEEEPPNINIF